MISPYPVVAMYGSTDDFRSQAHDELMHLDLGRARSDP